MNDPVGAVRPDPEPLLDYELERARGLAALAAGRLEEARHCFVAALGIARQRGRSELIDRAICNEAALAIELGEVDAPVPGLRDILVRNGNAENCALAARAIARAYELRKDYRKSLFYARLARDRAEQAHSPARLAAANNQIGNALLAQSFFQDAAASYRSALRQIDQESGDRRLICLANLGYCELLQGSFHDGLRRLYAVFREARRRGLKRVEAIARLDLCYAHLELERYATAERYGRTGLALAEWVGEPDLIKNALYLSGEVAVLRDDQPQARALFEQLQRRFYPEKPFVSEFLLSVDIRPLVNLRA